jgi:filamentous hemagglutinin family protein
MHTRTEIFLQVQEGLTFNPNSSVNVDNSFSNIEVGNLADIGVDLQL